MLLTWKRLLLAQLPWMMCLWKVCAACRNAESTANYVSHSRWKRHRGDETHTCEMVNNSTIPRIPAAKNFAEFSLLRSRRILAGLKPCEALAATTGVDMREVWKHGRGRQCRYQLVITGGTERKRGTRHDNGRTVV